MCNILVFVKPDNNHPDPEQDWKKFKAGDVIDIQSDDNFFWGNDIQGENSLGFWKTIIVPNVPKSELVFLLDSEQFEIESLLPEEKLNIKHQIRMKAINTELMKDVMSKEEIYSVIIEKQPLFDPNILG